MPTSTEISNSVGGQLNRLLAYMPMWLSSVVYTALTGLCFGLIYRLMHLLIIRWWAAAIVVVAVGITWGTIAYRTRVNARPVVG